VRWTFDRYLLEAVFYKAEHPEQRLGQAYFNILVRIRPLLAESIRWGALDPFHSDDRFPQFLNHVSAFWDFYDREEGES
jgi:hypothetical protein